MMLLAIGDHRSRLEVLQFGFAVSEGVVLQRDNVDLDLRDEPLQVDEVLHAHALDSVPVRLQHVVQIYGPDQTDCDVSVRIQHVGERR